MRSETARIIFLCREKISLRISSAQTGRTLTLIQNFTNLHHISAAKTKVSFVLVLRVAVRYGETHFIVFARIRVARFFCKENSPLTKTTHEGRADSDDKCAKQEDLKFQFPGVIGQDHFWTYCLCKKIHMYHRHDIFENLTLEFGCDLCASRNPDRIDRMVLHHSYKHSTSRCRMCLSMAFQLLNSVRCRRPEEREREKKKMKKRDLLVEERDKMKKSGLVCLRALALDESGSKCQEQCNGHKKLFL